MTISIRQLTLFAVVILAVSTVVLTADASDAEITEDGFEYQVADNGSAIIEGYTGNEVAVVIPSTISDESGTHKVVGIDNSAFYGKTMVEIVIPDSIEFIGDSAFANCPNLMFVTLQSTPMFGHNVFMLSSNLILMELSRSITLQDNIFNYGSSNISVYSLSGATLDCPGVQIEILDSTKSIVKFITTNEPDGVDVNSFSVVEAGSNLQLPSDAIVPGYDLVLTVGDQTVDGEYKVSQGSTTVVLEYSLHEYNVVFKNGDTVVQESKVKHGDVITAPSTNPTKDPDEKNTYTFAGWEGFTEGMTATQDMVFNAKFTETPRVYTVVFVSEGVTIQSQDLTYGATIVPPTENPTKPSEGSTDYRFVGWDGFTEGMTVTGDITFTAKFDPVDHLYTITFVSDGEEVSVLHLEYGAEIVAPVEDPVKDSVDGVDYVFAGWDGYTDNMTVTGDMTFEAIFEEAPHDDGGDNTWLYVAAVIIVILVVLAVLVLRKHL